MSRKQKQEQTKLDQNPCYQLRKQTPRGRKWRCRNSTSIGENGSNWKRECFGWFLLPKAGRFSWRIGFTYRIDEVCKTNTRWPLGPVRRRRAIKNIVDNLDSNFGCGPSRAVDRIIIRGSHTKEGERREKFRRRNWRVDWDQTTGWCTEKWIRSSADCDALRQSRGRPKAESIEDGARG